MANYIIKSTVIVWGGETHTIKITNELCNALESADINLYKMYIDSIKGGVPKMFAISDLITKILATVGVLADQQEILKAMTLDPNASVKLRNFSNQFLMACFPLPEEVDEKKPVSPKPKAKANKKS